jgi:trk system potassium uptake protein TrkH
MNWRATAVSRRFLGLHPATLVLLSFLGVIVAGTALLSLPFATRTGSIPFIDTVFTATSAVCVTGLITVDTGGSFSVFGQCVLLVLIQLGGLGIMTVSVALFRVVGRGVPFQHRMAVQDLFAQAPREDILKLVRNIFMFTATAELVGAVFLFLRWQTEFPLQDAAYLALFHSISAFCNAGFSLFPDSFERYAGDLWLNLSLCGLIVAGGLGFPVLHDLYDYARRRGSRRRRLAVQTKAVLVTSVILIIAGALLIALLERPSGGAGESTAERILTPVFQSVTCRTAGFNTLAVGGLGDATLFLLIVLMFVGASPGSTGGGIKTSTLAVLSAFTAGRIRRRRWINMFGKGVPDETVTRSAALVLLSIAVIAVVSFMLLAGNAVSRVGAEGSGRPFLACLFETVSAFGTVGLTMGVTTGLTVWSKAWIIVTMIVGRVGVLTFAYIIAGASPTKGFEHAKENVMVG